MPISTFMLVLALALGWLAFALWFSRRQQNRVAKLVSEVESTLEDERRSLDDFLTSFNELNRIVSELRPLGTTEASSLSIRLADRLERESDSSGSTLEWGALPPVPRVGSTEALDQLRHYLQDAVEDSINVWEIESTLRSLVFIRSSAKVALDLISPWHDASELDRVSGVVQVSGLGGAGHGYPVGNRLSRKTPPKRLVPA